MVGVLGPVGRGVPHDFFWESKDSGAGADELGPGKLAEELGCGGVVGVLGPLGTG